MSKAVAIRLPEELVAQSKAKAVAAGESFTAYVAGALTLRNAAPSILQQPMTPVTAIKPKRLQPTGNVPRATPERQSTWTRPKPDECAHPWRDNRDVCRVCGDQR